MEDAGIEVIQKRRELRNLVDQRDAKQRDLYHLNGEIEEATKKLRVMEKNIIVNRYANEFIEKLEKGVMTKDVIAHEISKLRDELGNLDITIKNRIYAKVISSQGKTGA